MAHAAERGRDCQALDRVGVPDSLDRGRGAADRASDEGADWLTLALREVCSRRRISETDSEQWRGRPGWWLRTRGGGGVAAAGGERKGDHRQQCKSRRHGVSPWACSGVRLFRTCKRKGVRETLSSPAVRHG